MAPMERSYLKHPKQYEAEREYVLALSRYLDREKDRPSPAVSLNERSFEIWGREKFLGSQEKREGELTGRCLLRHTGVSMEQLNIYETAEPIAYYCRNRQTPQNILLIENKDTFYSMRRHLMSGMAEILGMPVDTLIYGGGKRILKSFRDRSLCIEPYVQEEGNQWYYFGDLDFEGLRIYEQLQEKYPEIPLRPFAAAYEKMLRKGMEKFGMQHLPDTKEGQVRGLSGVFMTWFSQEIQEQMCQILDSGKYIPQEIINITDY